MSNLGKRLILPVPVMPFELRVLFAIFGMWLCIPAHFSWLKIFGSFNNFLGHAKTHGPAPRGARGANIKQPSYVWEANGEENECLSGRNLQTGEERPDLWPTSCPRVSSEHLLYGGGHTVIYNQSKSAHICPTILRRETRRYCPVSTPSVQAIVSAVNVERQTRCIADDFQSKMLTGPPSGR